MTGHAFGIGDYDLVRTIAEDATQGVDLRRGTAAARGRVGFVGNENHFRRNFTTGNAAAGFGASH